MARARITFQWPDGDALVCEIRVEDSFPDVVQEARAQCAALFRDGIAAARIADSEANIDED